MPNCGYAINGSVKTDKVMLSNLASQKGAERGFSEHDVAREGDPGFINTAAARHRYKRHDRAYGRFVLRRAEDLAREDRAFLQSGNNNLIQLASIHFRLLDEGFLRAMFEGDWTTAAAPTTKPMKPARIAADSTILSLDDPKWRDFPATLSPK
jgi:hypothetical protein